MAMLIDQKMNDGIAVPFFGRDAMTAPAIAEFALRYDMPLIPVRAVRTKDCHFEVTIYPPLAYEKTGDDEKDILAIMTQINAQLESWIREYPEQWFWVHKRWPNGLTFTSPSLNVTDNSRRFCLLRRCHQLAARIFHDGKSALQHALCN